MPEFSVISEKNISSVGRLKKPSRLFGMSVYKKRSFIYLTENINNYFLVYVRDKKETVLNLENEFINILTKKDTEVISKVEKEQFFILSSWDLEKESILMIIQKHVDCTISNYIADCEVNFGNEECILFDPKDVFGNKEDINFLNEKERNKLKELLRSIIR